jgi:hypothetical protein
VAAIELGLQTRLYIGNLDADSISAIWTRDGIGVTRVTS